MDDPAHRGVDPRVARTRHDILAAALRVLVDEGPDALTHQHIAHVAGYSKATLYKHWASRTHLLREAFDALGEMPHHRPTGNVRADLVAELTTFRTAIEDQQLDRALAGLVGLTVWHPELAAAREAIVTDGEHVMRGILGRVMAGAELEAATQMLCGSVFHAALMHGRPPADEVIAASVDLVLRSLDGAAHRPGADG